MLRFYPRLPAAQDPVTCARTDAYADYAGAFKCLKEGAADVAFTRHDIALTDTTINQVLACLLACLLGVLGGLGGLAERRAGKREGGEPWSMDIEQSASCGAMSTA